MAEKVLVLLGTRKGAFVMESDAGRKDWKVRGPYFKGETAMYVTFDPRTQTTLAAVGNPWFGSRIYRSADLGHTWDEPKSAPAFPEGTGLNVEAIWNVTPGRAEESGVIYAGVAPAALFKSTDSGETWNFINSLNDHPTRPRWNPGAGGLALHTIILDPSDINRMYIGVSAAGVFRTTDGGTSWNHANEGTRVNFEPDQPPEYAEWGQCVHKMALNPVQPKRLYQQNHCGVYRSDDGADSWTEVTEGLPSDFGFAIDVHPDDPDTVWVCPIISGYQHWVPGGEMAVYRTRDSGGSWQKLTGGFPNQDAYINVLRDGMAVDSLNPAGVYVGTNTGQLFRTADEGDTWQMAPELFPPINSVKTALV